MKLSLNNFLTAVKQIVVGGGRHTDNSPFNDSGYLHVSDAANLNSLHATASSGAALLARNVIILPVPSLALVVDSQVIETTIPYNFKVTNLLFRTDVAVTTGAKAATFTAGLDGTPMTGGVIALAGAQATGVATNSTSITALNSGTAGAKFSLTASAVTTFIEGNGHFEATVVNTDLANALQGTADETNATVVMVPAGTTAVGTIAWNVPWDFDEATDVLHVRVLASMATKSTDTNVLLASTSYLKVAGSALGSDLAVTAPTTVLSTTEQWLTFNFYGKNLKADNILYFKLATANNSTVGEEVLIHAIEFVYRSTLVSYHDTIDDTLTGTTRR